jgi:Tetratricopeptide repeat/FecR protein
VTASGCPSELDLTRALQGVADPAIDAHLVRCPSCRAIRDGWSEVIGLAREIPVDVPPLAHREAMRTSLLAAAAGSPTPGARRRLSGLVWGGAVAVAASCALWFVSRKPVRPAAKDRASIVAIDGADYKIVAPPPTETVWLRSGTLAFDVAPLRANERFKVMTGDGEVEVRGTYFEVTATGDKLAVVRVTRGHVEVRPLDRQSVLLGPGEIWRPEPPHPGEVAKPTAAIPHPRERPPHQPQWAARAERLSRSDSSPDATQRSPSPQEDLYDGAWDAMRSGDFPKAATKFMQVAEVAPRGPLADEGAFWRGVALARAGERTEAIAAFRLMLAGYPGSPRNGEASAMVGWLLIDEDPAGAARLFRAAISDSRPSVRDSARQGLNLLNHKGATARSSDVAREKTDVLPGARQR